ncbi:MAG: hypothetical protein JKY56_27390 [Kofleriaceae bacterium]|nr:hypothetical protein [Kofleriaceae bacterium]
MLKPFIYTAMVLASCEFAIGAGCTFDGNNTAQGFDQVDGETDGGGNETLPLLDSGIPAGGCPVGSDFICATGQPDSSWEVQQDILINTDSDSRCRTLVQPNNTKVCLFYVDGFTLADGVRLRAIGSRPLLIASDHDIVIHGIVDVSSARGEVPGASANSSVCNQGDSADSHFAGGGGGAGGSFQGPGGNGGTGNRNGLFDKGDGGLAGGVIASPTTLRGGCIGHEGKNSDGGSGGSSGGSVGFLAGNIFTLSQNARIMANGSGGQGASNSAGGGGAGTGGLVSISAQELILLGEISANGGGGGGGGSLFEDGGDGRNGSDAQAADGGVNSGSGGNGGKGSSSQALIFGEEGNSATAGAGGGGGGAGYIMLTGQVSSSVTTSPAPTYL